MAKKQESVSHTLPETLYVWHNTEENDPDSHYFQTEETLDQLASDVGGKRIVGVYKLVEFGQLKTKSEYTKGWA